MQTKLVNADKTGFISFMCEIISLYFSDFSDPQSICYSKKRFWGLFLVIFLVMVNVNLLWAVNVESEMLPMKLKGIATHQRVLKGEVREAFFPHLGLTPSLTERQNLYVMWLDAERI